MNKKGFLRFALTATSGVLLGSVAWGLQSSSYAQVPSDAELEGFLEQTPGTLDGLGNGDATEGAAIRQTFVGTAGQTVTLDWNFLTNEAVPNTLYNDFSFISILPLGGTSTLADTNSRFPLLGNNTNFNRETGFNTFSYVLPADGPYTVGLGVVDVGDRVVNSGLLVDNVSVGNNGSFETGDFSGWETIGNVRITDSNFGNGPTDGDFQAVLNVPEPSTILGSGVLLGLGAVLKRKVRQQRGKEMANS